MRSETATGARLGRDWTSSKWVQQRNWTLCEEGPAKGPLYPIWRNMPQEQKALVRHSNDRDRHLTSHGASVRKKTAEGTHEWGMQDAHPRIMQERGIPEGAERNTGKLKSETRKWGRGKHLVIVFNKTLTKDYDAKLLTWIVLCTSSWCFQAVILKQHLL